MNFRITTLVVFLSALLHALPPVEEINLNPDVEAVQNRAKAYSIVADTEKELNEALRALPVDETPDRVMRRGVIVRAAIEKFEEALRLFPNYASAHEQLAYCYVRLDTSESVEPTKRHFREALRLDPARVNTHHSLINMLLVRKSFDEAEEAAKSLAKVDPQRGAAMIEEVAAMREVAKSREH